MYVGKTPVFLTNLLGPTAATIRALYKARWQVELFFKWIKQHFRIKQFHGTPERTPLRRKSGLPYCGLRAGRHRQEEASPGRLSVHFATGFLGHTVRENPFKQGVYEYGILLQRHLAS